MTLYELLHGIGRIKSEFLIEGELSLDYKGAEIGHGEFWGQCIEIMLSEEPRF